MNIEAPIPHFEGIDPHTGKIAVDGLLYRINRSEYPNQSSDANSYYKNG